MIKIEMLRAFAEVARTGNLVTASEALGRTPSAISMTLKQFEEHLGQPLFETERKNRLTALGSYTLEMAERELAHFDRTLNALADYAGARAGEVRLAVVPSFAMSVLPALAADFLRENPRTRLDVHDLDTASILRALERERIDIGIVSDARASPDLRIVRLASDPFGLVLRAGHPLAARGPVGWDELSRVDLIANPLCAQIGIPELQEAFSRARLHVHNTTTLIAMVRAGLGVTVLPRLVTHHADRQIAFAELTSPGVARQVDLVMRSRDTPNPATQVFRDFLIGRTRSAVAALAEGSGRARPARKG